MKLKALLSVLLIVALLLSPIALMEESIEQKAEPDGGASIEGIIEEAPVNEENTAASGAKQSESETEVLPETVDAAVPEDKDAELTADVAVPEAVVFGMVVDEAENGGAEESDEAAIKKETDVENPKMPENQSDIPDQPFSNDEAQSEAVELIGEASSLDEMEAEEADLSETNGISSNYLEDSDMEIDVDSSSNLEVAMSVSAEAESGKLLAAESSGYVPAELSITVGKSRRYTLNNGDSLRITTKGDLASWSSGKSSVASIDTVEGNTLHVVTHKPGKATITAVLKNRKKIRIKLTVKNPYLPKSVSFVNMPSSLVVGDTLSLNEHIAFEPAYATSSMKWKSSNKRVIRVDKSGNFVALKPGKAKITAKTGNKKSRAIKLTVRSNAISGLNQRPSKAVITALGNAFTLWPKSICYKGNNRIVCEFYLLNGTNNKIKFIRDLNLGIYLGDQNNILARQVFSKIKVKGRKKGTSTFKVIFSGGGVLQPNAHLADWATNQVLFDLDQASVYATTGNSHIAFSRSVIPNLPGSQDSGQTTFGGSGENADYMEVSPYFEYNLKSAAQKLGLNNKRYTDSEVPNVYYNDALEFSGNTDVECIKLKGVGYTVFGVAVGMDEETAKQLMVAKGNPYRGKDSADNRLDFEHPTSDPNAVNNYDGYNSVIYIYLKDGKVSSVDWESYT